MVINMLNDIQKSALYKKYLAIHEAYQADSNFFSIKQSNIELTTVMGGRPWSWHVVGITKAALIRYKELDFKYVAKSGITRAHLIPRIETTQKLLLNDQAYSMYDFFKIWLDSDKTVICGPGENKKGFNIEFIQIENDEFNFFNSASIGLKFRADHEGQLLRKMYEKYFLAQS
jgi:hypothetical protein